MAKKNQVRRNVKKTPKRSTGAEQSWSLLTWPVDLRETVTIAEAAISQIECFCAIEGRPETSYRMTITTSNMLGRRQVRGGMRRLWAVVNPSEPSVDPEVLMHTVRLHEREKKQREQEVDQREQKEVTGFTLEEISAYNNLRLIVDRIGDWERATVPQTREGSLKEFPADLLLHFVEAVRVLKVLKLHPGVKVEFSTRHFTPTELRTIYGCGQDKLLRMLHPVTGSIRNIRHNARDYQIAVDDLPAEAR